MDNNGLEVGTVRQPSTMVYIKLGSEISSYHFISPSELRSNTVTVFTSRHMVSVLSWRHL